jgi:predicted hydrolase (HD superfamily)
VDPADGLIAAAAKVKDEDDGWVIRLDEIEKPLL